jgi:hypothetical protein
MRRTFTNVNNSPSEALMHVSFPKLITPTRWPSVVLRWMPTFIGFPAGGLAAKLVIGRVDNVGAAIIGGALSGAILGTVQWLALRRHGPTAQQWIAVTAAGFAIGLGLGSAAVGYHTDLTALAVQGAVSGLIVGGVQAGILYGFLGRLSIAWPLLLAGLWALGWTITSAAGIDVEAQYTVFGSSGALVVTAATSILSVALARSQQVSQP